MDILLLPLQLMGLVLIVFPPAALVPAFAFAALSWRRRSRWCAAAALAWLVYAAYESAMALRILCTGECNIRIDLLAIYPLLLWISMVAVIAAILGARRGSPDDSA